MTSEDQNNVQICFHRYKKRNFLSTLFSVPVLIFFVVYIFVLFIHVNLFRMTALFCLGKTSIHLIKK